eukprot:6188751-Pleurochrysis_carterae.AAC.4
MDAEIKLLRVLKLLCKLAAISGIQRTASLVPFYSDGRPRAQLQFSTVACGARPASSRPQCLLRAAQPTSESPAPKRAGALSAPDPAGTRDFRPSLELANQYFEELCS